MDITYIKTTESNLNSVPIIDGQLIYASDSGKQYSDFNGSRKRDVFGNEIDAMNENGCCNILPNNASSGTSHNVTFTVNADKTVSFVVNSTPDANATLLLASSVRFSSTQLKVFGLPDIEGCYAYLYDNTSGQYKWIEANGATITVNPDHTYDCYIHILNTVPVGTTGTYYPMLYDARLKPTSYVSYSMTNRELTNAVSDLVILETFSNQTSDIGGNIFIGNKHNYVPIAVQLISDNATGAIQANPSFYSHGNPAWLVNLSYIDDNVGVGFAANINCSFNIWWMKVK